MGVMSNTINEIKKASFGDIELEQVSIGDTDLLPVRGGTETVLGFSVIFEHANLFVPSDYILNSIDGETIIVPLANIQLVAGEELNSDCTNLRFRDTASSLFLEHKYINNQGIRFFFLKLPFNMIKNVHLSGQHKVDLEVVISGDVFYFGDTNIFEYYHNIKELGTYPASMCTTRDFPTFGEISPATGIINNEIVVKTPSYVNNNFLVGSFDFQHVLTIYNHGGNHQHGCICLNQVRNSHPSDGSQPFNSDCQSYSGDGPNGNADWGKPFYKQKDTFSSQLTSPLNTWLLLDFRASDSTTGYHYPNLIGNPSHFATLNTSWNKIAGEYIGFRKWNATSYISLVCSLKNPYTSKNGAITITPIHKKNLKL